MRLSFTPDLTTVIFCRPTAVSQSPKQTDIIIIYKPLRVLLLKLLIWDTSLKLINALNTISSPLYPKFPQSLNLLPFRCISLCLESASCFFRQPHNESFFFWFIISADRTYQVTLLFHHCYHGITLTMTSPSPWHHCNRDVTVTMASLSPWHHCLHDITVTVTSLSPSHLSFTRSLVFGSKLTCLWSPYGIGQTIIFSSCGFFFLLLSFLA